MAMKFLLSIALHKLRGKETSSQERRPGTRTIGVLSLPQVGYKCIGTTTVAGDPLRQRRGVHQDMTPLPILPRLMESRMYRQCRGKDNI